MALDRRLWVSVSLVVGSVAFGVAIGAWVLGNSDTETTDEFTGLRLEYAEIEQAVAASEIIVEARFLNERAETVYGPFRRDDLVRQFEVLEALRGGPAEGDVLSTRWTVKRWFPAPPGAPDVVQELQQPELEPGQTYLLFLMSLAEPDGSTSLAVVGDPGIAELAPDGTLKFFVTDWFGADSGEPGPSTIPEGFLHATRADVETAVQRDDARRASRPPASQTPATIVVPPEGQALQALLDELPGLNSDAQIQERARELGLYGLSDSALCQKVESIVRDQLGRRVPLGCPQRKID